MSKISIYDIAKILVEKNGLTKSESEQFVAAIFDVIQEGLHNDNLVKVKGLGTFKIIGVEARESVNVNTGERVVIDSHGKVTFTPDAVMRELVNKPFSQFETVALNDGIEFDDLTDDKSELITDDTSDSFAADSSYVAELSGRDGISISHDDKSVATEPMSGPKSLPSADELPEQATEEVSRNDNNEISPSAATDSAVESVAEPCSEEQTDESAVVADSVKFGTVYAEEEQTDKSTVVSDAPDDTESAEPSVAHTEPIDKTTNSEDVPSSDPATSATRRNNSTVSWIIFTIISIILILAAFCSGYRYGLSVLPPASKPAVIIKKMMVPVSVPDSLQSVRERSVEKQDSSNNTAQTRNAGVVETNERSEAAIEDDDFSKYAKKDIRVRTGAYTIIGTDRVRTVRKGETLAGIARSTLGEGMSCYIEVYNDLESNVELKAGQKIKIPKLKLKRKSARK